MISGLVFVVVLLAAAAIWAARATADTGRDAQNAGVVADAFDDASAASAAQDFWVTEYLLLLGPEAKHLDPVEIRESHAAAASSFVRALDVVRHSGAAADRILVRKLLADNRRYLAAARRMFAQIDANDPKAAIQIEIADIDPVFGDAQVALEKASDPHRAAAANSLETVDSLVQIVLLSTLVGVVLTLTLAGALIRLRRRAGRRLQSERDFLAAVLHSIADGIVTCDVTGKHTLYNRASRELLGVEDDDAADAAVATLRVYRDDGTPIEAEDWPLARALRGETISQFEAGVSVGDGPVRDMRTSGQPIIDSEGRRIGAVIALQDITEKRRAQEALRATEEQLRQTQRIEAVGQLAGGVAHDFNNLLTAISGYSQLALSRLDERPDPELQADIEQIAKSGERAACLTRQLLALSRRQTLQPTVFDLNDAVADTESLLGRLLGEHITIARTLDSSECSIQADHGQIEQVIMNLALNSRDAMQDGGVLRIETEVVRLSSGEALKRFQAPAGEYVVLRVADDGCGMDRKTQLRASEPFYTTKALGEGTGLGLATVYGIVAQSGGYIALDSKPGVGTTFEVLLPHVAVSTVATKPAPAPARNGAGERILLVEDEDVVRDFTKLLLTRAGYEVTVASDGRQALQLSRDHTFDLVITDMVMPQMSGKALAKRLGSERPGLPIVFISGYAHDVSGGNAEAVEGFLQKPFSAHDLFVTVQESLDRAPTRAA